MSIVKRIKIGRKSYRLERFRDGLLWESFESKSLKELRYWKKMWKKHPRV